MLSSAIKNNRYDWSLIINYVDSIALSLMLLSYSSSCVFIGETGSAKVLQWIYSLKESHKWSVRQSHGDNYVIPECCLSTEVSRHCVS